MASSSSSNSATTTTTTTAAAVNTYHPPAPLAPPSSHKPKLSQEQLGDWTTPIPTPYAPIDSDSISSKIVRDPFVSLAALGVVGSLAYGLTSFRKGDARSSQMGMRMRVGGQFLAISLIIGYILHDRWNEHVHQQTELKPASASSTK